MECGAIKGIIRSFQVPVLCTILWTKPPNAKQKMKRGLASRGRGRGLSSKSWVGGVGGGGLLFHSVLPSLLSPFTWQWGQLTGSQTCILHSYCNVLILAHHSEFGPSHTYTWLIFDTNIYCTRFTIFISIWSKTCY